MPFTLIENLLNLKIEDFKFKKYLKCNLCGMQILFAVEEK